MTVERGLWIVALLAAGYLAFRVGSCQGPDVRTLTRTDTTYVDRVRPETTVVTKPVERIVYERVTDTAYVSLPVPSGWTQSGFNVRGLVGANPIDIDGRRVTLTRWDPQALRFTQDVYAVERRDWRLWPEIGVERTVWGYQTGARLQLRYRRVSGYVGYAVGIPADGPDRSVLTFGLYLSPFTIRF